MARDYRKLRVFDLADALALDVYRVTKAFPREEIFGLTSQMRRAALPVPANIVEGCSRESEGEFVRFLDMARGSLAEVGYYLRLSHRLGYLPEKEFTHLDGDFNVCARSLQALINSFSRKPRTRDQGLKTD